MVVIVVALDDCTISVTNAPQNAPDNGVAATLLNVVRSREPANALRPLGMTLMPSRNRPTPRRTEVVVDIQASSGASARRDVSRANAARTAHVYVIDATHIGRTTTWVSHQRYPRSACLYSPLSLPRRSASGGLT